ncbi:hypothetical protein CcI6DRAFT_01925 [Frankia sp. CcI6]|nr:MULTISPECIES: YcaO-like family protein [unclassified Frankia]ETA02539.1 hypothetical protein CcI6DRAFT_01925 [Frankia sp. CcI6]KDA42096.1 hypothetical protein BMG523Draft_03108 [Frankia sp. BMG5.23]OHV49660.1 bacteriocin biosynthesis protein SagD [Frankia sp. CgIS1]ORT48993.1 bacteriocin biosynthesis protein SagD [Frankia sp. KB5]
MRSTTPAPAERRLVDRRLGVLTQIVPYQPSPAMPRCWVGWSARAADTRAFATWSAERFGFGAALGDHDRARRAAVGEAVERYCGNAVPDALEIACYDDLARAGRPALDPATLALYSDRQYRARGFPFRPFTRQTPVAWVPGRDLYAGGPVLVPASMAYLNYFRGAHADEVATHAMLYAGIATGENREHAERFALEELFERDANTIWWASGAAGWAVADAAELLDRHDIAHGEGTGRTIRLFQVPSQFPVPVLAAFLEEPGRGLIAYGTACRADPREAATKALVEAFAMLELTAELADGDSAHWRAVARGEIPPHTYLPYRADRRYADDIRPDFRDLVDLPAVAQLYLDPRMQGRPLDRLRDDTRTTRLADIPRADGDANGGTAHRRYLDMLATQGLSAVSVDVTTPDVRAAGLTVVRVIVPGLYGNPPAAFPFLGGERLYDVPAQLGLAAGKITEDALYPYPIPHV